MDSISMKSFSLLFFIKKSKLLQNGEAPICMRVTLNRERAEAMIKRSVDPKKWGNKVGYAIGGDKLARELNSCIETIRAKILAIQREMLNEREGISAKAIVDRFFGRDCADKHKTLVELYVTVHFLRKYEKEMLSQEFSRNTIGIHIRHLRAIMNIGLRKGIISERQYPFGKMIQGKYEIPVQRKIPQSLDTDEVKQIIAYEAKDYEEDWAKDMWLFSFYCNGMNMVDIFNLQYSSIRGEFIYFIREKTKHTCRILREIEIAITPPIRNIIDKWGRKPQHKNRFIFEVFDSHMDVIEKQEARKIAIDTMNRSLRKIVKNLGINKRLSTSIARYCWATTLLREGMPMTYISKGLGHTSYNTTEKYLADFDQQSKIEAGNILIEITKYVK